MNQTMYICDRCGKGSQNIMNVSHSHRRTQKTAMPNLHRISITIRGEKAAMRLCTKCVRLVRAQEKASNSPVVKPETVPTPA